MCALELVLTENLFMKKPFRHLELALDYGKITKKNLENKTLDDWQQDVQLRYAVTHSLAGVGKKIKE